MMNEFLESVITGVISNILFTILLIIFGWGVYKYTARKRLVNFFDIGETKRIVIYLSNLTVVSGGAVGIDSKKRSYSGKAVVYQEQEIANKFKNLFNFLIPALSDSSSFLGKILFSDIKVEIFPSPATDREVDSSTSIISLGSPGYNQVSKMIENQKATIGRFCNDNREVCVENIPPISDPYTGFVQKIRDKSKNRSYFYVAGIAEIGTIGAANFLLEEWSKLRKKYGKDGEFFIMIRFNGGKVNNWTIDFEREISS